ncbi:MAG: serine/threonine-protein kinase [Nannocystaceae bacterium]|nr:serine/threonine-protein kinase [Nannocystaceae bacterium]
MSASASSFERDLAREAVRARLFGGEASPPAGAEPRKLARYEVRGTLGRGGLGVVYRAWDPLLGREVALKVLHGARARSGATDPGRDALLLEARSLARVSSPNIVPVFDVGTADGVVYLAMELVEGGHVRTWLAQQRRSTAEIVALFAGAAAGLAAVHRAGLVHRDFKPENVLIDASGRARVADFGLARALPSEPSKTGPDGRESEDDTDEGTIAGTLAYMAPELLQGQRATVASDVWAFAVALHESLFRQRPFAGTTVMAMLESIERGPAAPMGLDRRGGALRRVLLRGMAVDPRARWPDVESLAAAAVRAARGPRWFRSAALAAAAAGTAAMFIGGVGRTATEPCVAAQHRFASVTDAGRRADALARLEGTDEQRERVAAAWQAAIDGWQQAHATICTASAETADATDVAVACLGQATDELDTLLASVTPARAVPATAMMDATTSLTDTATCGRARATARASEDSEHARTVLSARWAVELGDYAGGLALIEGVWPELDAAADPGLAARALWVRGVARLNHGEMITGMADVEAAFHLAVLAPDAATAAETADALAFDRANRLGDVEAAQTWLRAAQTWVDRGATSPDASTLAVTAAAIEVARHDEPAAIAILQRALAAEPCRDCGSRFAVLQGLCGVLRPRDALPYARQAWALQAERYGERSVATVEAAAMLAYMLGHVGELDEAFAVGDAAREIAESLPAFGADYHASLLAALAHVQLQRRKYPEAVALLERAVALTSTPEVAPSEYVISLRFALGRAYRAAGDPRALPTLQESTVALEALRGGDSDELAYALAVLAAAQLAAGEHDEGRSSATRASAIVAARGGIDPERLAEVLGAQLTAWRKH